MKNVILFFVVLMFALSSGCEINIDEELVDSVTGDGDNDSRQESFGGGGGHKDHHHHSHRADPHMDGCFENNHGDIECDKYQHIHFTDQHGEPVRHQDVYLFHKHSRTTTRQLETGYDGQIEIDHYLCGDYEVRLANNFGKYKVDRNGVSEIIDFCANADNHHRITLYFLRAI